MSSRPSRDSDLFRGRLRHGSEDLFHDAGGMVAFDEDVAVLAAPNLGLALVLVGHDETVVMGFELRAFTALAAAAGTFGAAFSLRRRITAVRPEIEDGVQVGRQVVGKRQRAIDERGFDGILPKLFIGALLQDGE